jgi:elongation factor 3
LVIESANSRLERHLEKTPIAYIQWRFQDGHDREILEKVTRILTPEEQAVLDSDWVGKDGSKRKLEVIPVSSTFYP